MGLGENVARLRKAAHLTQQQLAVAAGLAVSVVSQLEQGKNQDPRLSTLSALATGLGVTLDELVKDEGAEAEETGSGSAPTRKRPKR
jgi:transcriptional regulator with XRE-family HTH domain